MAAPLGRGAAAAPAPPHPAPLPLSAICPASAPHRLPPTQPANRFFAQLLGLSTFELSQCVSLKRSRTLFSRSIVFQSRPRSAAGEEIYLSNEIWHLKTFYTKKKCNQSDNETNLDAKKLLINKLRLSAKPIMRRQIDLRTISCNKFTKS